ncbi:MAG: peroxide stress protein YaaA [Candidatus Heimdallarchaeota archaeon]|nr:MAG: peroxide stress protein YaaA [Candidatus Heimdallarchaeota archaeon]
MKKPKVLLIISCGKKKALELQNREIRASEAYKGPMFQVIRKAKREGRWSSHLFLGIVSAKYGFLRSTDLIKDYDLKMTENLARKHNSQVIQEVIRWNKEEEFDYIYILMGKTYLKAIEGLKTHIDTKIIVENMGGLGVGQQKLVRFLENLSRTKSLEDFLF